MANSDSSTDLFAVAEPVPIHPLQIQKLQEEMVLDFLFFIFWADSDSVRGCHQS